MGSAGGTTTASALATSRSARGMTRRIGPPMRRYSTARCYAVRSWHPCAKQLVTPGAIDVGRVAEEDFRRLHHRLGQRRMRVDGHRHVLRGGAHLDREHAL